LRYRTGAGGRQPVTQDLFDGGESRMVAGATDSTALRIVLAFPAARERPVGLLREMTLWFDRP
ncbi:MAG: hypothetical protein R3234_14020, partial [Thermoanaerobaculia bacterium]|nr:hypothetical protein [Thermoanaerobaculia bacterium]